MQLEDLFSEVSAYGAHRALPSEVADRIASTAGEIMVELSDQRGDPVARGAIEDARRLREAARTLCPEPAKVAAAGRTLASDLEQVIREDKRAA